MSTFTLISYRFQLDFDAQIPRELEPMAEGLVHAIDGVDTAIVRNDWMEVTIDAEYVREQNDENEYFDRVRALCTEVVDTVTTARLLLTKIEGGATP